jgi:pilus assembly protein Flp/PilA
VAFPIPTQSTSHRQPVALRGTEFFDITYNTETYWRFDMTKFMRVLRNEKGQGLTEYALIIALVAIVAVAALTLLGGQIDTIFGTITSSLGGAA